MKEFVTAVLGDRPNQFEKPKPDPVKAADLLDFAGDAGSPRPACA
jgi:hypothetical protein